MTSLTANVHQPSPSDDEVRAQLEAILSSIEFIAPDRTRRLFRYIVEETLAGRASYLKAYTIAQVIFGRKASFDAQTDPCVRITARQLRVGLERYYLTAGRADKVLITVPSGRYVPLFTSRAGEPPVVPVVAQTDELATAKQSTIPTPPQPPMRREGKMIRWVMIGAAMIVLAAVVLASVAERKNPARSPANGGRPTIVVERFEDIGKSSGADEVLSGLTDEIVVNLAKFKQVVVIARDGAPAEDANQTYTLQGSVRLEGGDLRSIARLVRRTDGVVVWSSDYNLDTKGRSMLDVEEGIARSIATAIAARFGADAKFSSEGSVIPKFGNDSAGK